MQPQWLSMNVTSNTHVRSSPGSSKLIHSWAPSVACSSAMCQLPPQLAGGQEALPELIHHHPFVGCVETVAREAHAEEQDRRFEDAAQRLFGPASTFAREQRLSAPHPGDGPPQGADGRVAD